MIMLSSMTFVPWSWYITWWLYYDLAMTQQVWKTMIMSWHSMIVMFDDGYNLGFLGNILKNLMRTQDFVMRNSWILRFEEDLVRQAMREMNALAVFSTPFEWLWQIPIGKRETSSTLFNLNVRNWINTSMRGSCSGSDRGSFRFDPRSPG